jgi:cAMP-dependent protein kinase regulator
MDNQKYLETKIRPIMDGMILQLISERPENPANFILDWLQKTGGYTQNGLTQDETDELENLRIEMNKFKSLIIEDEIEKILSDQESDEEIKQNEIEDKKKSIKGKGKRTGVSAEAYGKFNKKEDYKPRYIPKSDVQIKRITNKISQSFIFNSLDEKGMKIIIGAMEEKIFYPGDYVIKQGDHGNCLYIVESGKLDCYKKFINNEEKLVKQYIEGDSFGELALLYNAPRAASVIAKSKCILWALDRETFIHIVKNETVKKREKYEKFLKSVEAFRGMDSYELSLICDVLKPCIFKPGEYVIREVTYKYKLFLG